MASFDSQLDQLRVLLAKIAASDSYYSGAVQSHLGDGAGLESVEEFASKFWFTTKDDLVRDREAHPPFGSNLTEPLANYTRFCQTSGTSTGKPMPVLDTPESWEAMLGSWREVFRGAGLKPGVDRVFFAFSFGPFLGFWTAFEAAATDYLSLPGGGLSSKARLEHMARLEATVLCCTPTYAIRLGELIGTDGFPEPEELDIHTLIVAGEPGGSLTSVRTRLSELWRGARVYDHHGMTEVGPVTWEHPERAGVLCLDHGRYLCEIVDAQTGEEVLDGDEGELVLTTLARTACPLLRYRSGDRVRKLVLDDVVHLDGGILGRVDDMVIVRGVNLYPSAVEEVVRSHPEVVEFRVLERNIESMAELEIEVETTDPTVLPRLESALRERFALRIPVTEVAADSLPRFEFKSQRWSKPE